MPLMPGDQAPDVTLPAHDGRQVRLSELWSQQPLVVLFFPLAFTSTCTEELCAVGSDLAAYQELDAQPVAVSVDSPFVLARFRAECGAEYPFLSDFNRQATEGFGVLRTDPVGPGLRNASDRAAFVIGRDGTVRYTWHSPNPRLLPPFEEIKEALRQG
ncbi:MAG: redoxin domain-containing protein [Gemmatimonadota bacterium]|nr:redoxin domain-containing protein [Gemmatimonadota bacterium]